MHSSLCGRYYFDVVDALPEGFIAVFSPKDGWPEQRGIFEKREQAAHAIYLLAIEHGFADAPVEGQKR